MSIMASIPCLAGLSRCVWLEKAWSYNALLAALPTFPKSCVAVKAHFPASFCANEGCRKLVSIACFKVVVICLMRCWQGLIVM